MRGFQVKKTNDAESGVGTSEAFRMKGRAERSELWCWLESVSKLSLEEDGTNRATKNWFIINVVGDGIYESSNVLCGTFS